MGPFARIVSHFLAVLGEPVHARGDWLRVGGPSKAVNSQLLLGSNVLQEIKHSIIFL